MNTDHHFGGVALDLVMSKMIETAMAIALALALGLALTLALRKTIG